MVHHIRLRAAPFEHLLTLFALGDNYFGTAPPCPDLAGQRHTERGVINVFGKRLKTALHGRILIGSWRTAQKIVCVQVIGSVKVRSNCYIRLINIRRINLIFKPYFDKYIKLL